MLTVSRKNIQYELLDPSTSTNGNISPDVKQLIYSLLDTNSDNRITAMNALKLPVFTNQQSNELPLIALITEHDKSFKELARLEDRLEKITQLEAQSEQLNRAEFVEEHL